MSRIRRMATLVGGGIAVCAALLGSTAATASAAQAHPTAPAATRAAAVTPANQVCGFNSGGLWGQATYENCSNYSVEIRVEWWFSDDTYLCVPAHFSDALNNVDQTAPYYADFDGRTNC